MKRNIVIIGAFLVVALLISACATRQNVLHTVTIHTMK